MVTARFGHFRQNLHSIKLCRVIFIIQVREFAVKLNCASCQDSIAVHAANEVDEIRIVRVMARNCTQLQLSEVVVINVWTDFLQAIIILQLFEVQCPPTLLKIILPDRRKLSFECKNIKVGWVVIRVLRVLDKIQAARGKILSDISRM